MTKWQTTGAATDRQGQPTVLVIDDDPGLRAVLQRLLDDEGFATCAAADEQSALAILESEPVDLIITDALSFRPPYREFESVWLRELVREAKGAPVVLLTGYTEAIRLDPADLGLAAILTKPFELDALCAAIHTALGRPSPIVPARTERAGQTPRLVVAAR